MTFHSHRYACNRHPSIIPGTTLLHLARPIFSLKKESDAMTRLFTLRPIFSLSRCVAVALLSYSIHRTPMRSARQFEERVSRRGGTTSRWFCRSPPAQRSVERDERNRQFVSPGDVALGGWMTCMAPRLIVRIREKWRGPPSTVADSFRQVRSQRIGQDEQLQPASDFMGGRFNSQQ